MIHSTRLRSLDVDAGRVRTKNVGLLYNCKMPCYHALLYAVRRIRVFLLPIHLTLYASIDSPSLSFLHFHACIFHRGICHRPVLHALLSVSRPALRPVHIAATELNWTEP